MYRMETSSLHYTARLLVLQLLIDEGVTGLLALLLPNSRRARLFLEALLVNKYCNWWVTSQSQFASHEYVIQRDIDGNLNWNPCEVYSLDKGFREAILLLVSTKPSYLQGYLHDAHHTYALLHGRLPLSKQESIKPEWLRVTDMTYLVYYFLHRGRLPPGISSAYIVSNIMKTPIGTFDTDDPNYLRALKYYSACTLAGYFFGSSIPCQIHFS